MQRTISGRYISHRSCRQHLSDGYCLVFGVDGVGRHSEHSARPVIRPVSPLVVPPRLSRPAATTLIDLVAGLFPTSADRSRVSSTTQGPAVTTPSLHAVTLTTVLEMCMLCWTSGSGSTGLWSCAATSALMISPPRWTRRRPEHCSWLVPTPIDLLTIVMFR